MLARLHPLRVIEPATLEYGLRLIMLEGVAAQIMVVLTGGAFLVAFALTLGASPLTIGLLGALQPLTQILQIPAIYLVERVGWRKLVVLAALTLSRLFCFVLAAIPWVVPPSQRIPVFIGALLAYYGLGTISGVAWNPWLRDLIPEDRLGRYMAGRLALITAVGALLGLAAAGGVDLYQSGSPTCSASSACTSRSRASRGWSVSVSSAACRSRAPSTTRIIRSGGSLRSLCATRTSASSSDSWRAGTLP